MAAKDAHKGLDYEFADSRGHTVESFMTPGRTCVLLSGPVTLYSEAIRSFALPEAPGAGRLGFTCQTWTATAPHSPAPGSVA